MSSHRRGLVGAISMVAALALGACGDGTSPRQQAGTNTTLPSGLAGAPAHDAATQAPVPADAAIGTGGPAYGTTGAGASGSTGAADGYTDPAAHPLAPSTTTPLRQGAVQNPNHDTVPVPLTVESKHCARVGTSLRVTVTSEPDVDVAMIIGYSDKNGHDSQSVGTTGPEGRLVLDVPVSAAAPTGTADLLVVASAPDGRRNHHESKIQIVRADEDCP